MKQHVTICQRVVPDEGGDPTWQVSSQTDSVGPSRARRRIRQGRRPDSDTEGHVREWRPRARQTALTGTTAPGISGNTRPAAHNMSVSCSSGCGEVTAGNECLGCHVVAPIPQGEPIGRRGRKSEEDRDQDRDFKPGGAFILAREYARVRVEGGYLRPSARRAYGRADPSVVILGGNVYQHTGKRDGGRAR